MMRLFLAALALLFLALPGSAAALEVGDAAPAFEAESTTGTVKLADYLGKKNVLLAVYYKDFTSG